MGVRVGDGEGLLMKEQFTFQRNYFCIFWCERKYTVNSSTR